MPTPPPSPAAPNTFPNSPARWACLHLMPEEEPEVLLIGRLLADGTQHFTYWPFSWTLQEAAIPGAPPSWTSIIKQNPELISIPLIVENIESFTYQIDKLNQEFQSTPPEWQLFDLADLALEAELPPNLSALCSHFKIALPSLETKSTDMAQCLLCIAMKIPGWPPGQAAPAPEQDNLAMLRKQADEMLAIQLNISKLNMPKVLVDLARKALNATVLSSLASRNFPEVNLAIASNPCTGAKDACQALCNDLLALANQPTRAALARRDDLDSAALNAISNACTPSDVDIYANLLSHRNCSAELQERLVLQVTPIPLPYLAAISNNPGADVEILIWIAATYPQFAVDCISNVAMGVGFLYLCARSEKRPERLKAIIANPSSTDEILSIAKSRLALLTTPKP